jgi:hypothetical protein
MPPASTPHVHLLAVWNPTYATDPLEAHLRLLLQWDARAEAEACAPDDVYVWWGKVRSSHRLQPMPHLEAIVALGEALADAPEEHELHLYLTDYRSLYVADVEHVATDDPRVGDAEHVPPYYAERALHCDCWFRVRDVRALVRGDLEGVASELARLRNTRYHSLPVSLYGGMVELPLIVSRADQRRYFQDGERDLLADGKRWVRFDAEQGGVGALEATLRDDHLGERAWAGLDTAARHFLATAERTLREHRGDPAADLSPVVVGYAKALEVQLNRLLADAAAAAPLAARQVNVNGRTVELPQALPLPLGTIARALVGEPALRAHVTTLLHDGAWCTYELPAILDNFVEIRNAAAHGGAVTRAQVIEWRNRLLGVGCESVVGRLALVRKRAGAT